MTNQRPSSHAGTRATGTTAARTVAALAKAVRAAVLISVALAGAAPWVLLTDRSASPLPSVLLVGSSTLFVALIMSVEGARRAFGLRRRRAFGWALAFTALPTAVGTAAVDHALLFRSPLAAAGWTATYFVLVYVGATSENPQDI